MMKLSLVVLACLVIAGLSQSPPFWGGNPRYTVKVKMLYDQPIVRWNFTYYYDWSLKAERYEHQAPQQDEMCMLPDTSFQKAGLPCVVTFASDGWSYISFPSQNFCCQCTNSFGAVRYDWLQQNSTYLGIEIIEGKSVTHWTKMGNFMNQYFSTVDKQLPVRYYEIIYHNPKSWDFDLDTYSTGPIDPSKLGPQCSTRCSGRCTKFNATQEVNLQSE